MLFLYFTAVCIHNIMFRFTKGNAILNSFCFEICILQKPLKCQYFGRSLSLSNLLRYGILGYQQIQEQTHIMCLTLLVFLQLTLYTSCPSIQFLVFHEVASQECGNKKQKHWKEYHYFHSFCSHINQEVCNFSLLNLNFQCSLTLFRMSFFGAPHGWVGGKKGPPPPSLKAVTHTRQ